MSSHRMRGIPAALAALAALLAAASGCSAPASTNGTQVTHQAGPHATGQAGQSVMEYLSDMTRRGNFSGTVLVAERGRVVLRAAFGMSDAANHEPNRPATQFRIASLTKQFTAMAILQLQDEGRLAVTDRICRYLVQCPPSWTHITIAQLLAHTSGIPDYESFPDYPQWSRQPTTPERIAALAAQHPLLFEPGSRFSYSNTGYVLLGMIVTRASGLSYPDFLRRHVFAPLHMQHTGYDEELSVAYSAGGLYSTIDDLSRWDTALLSALHGGQPQLVSSATLRQMFRPQVEVVSGHPEEGWYGYGWYIDLGGAEYDHDGLISGFTAENAIFPAAGAQIIVLSNNQDTDIRTITEHLAAAVGLQAR